MPRGLAPKLILSVSAIVLVVVAVFGFVNTRIQERDLLDEVVRGTDHLSNTITSATWDAMLADHRENLHQPLIQRVSGRIGPSQQLGGIGLAGRRCLAGGHRRQTDAE